MKRSGKVREKGQPKDRKLRLDAIEGVYFIPENMVWIKSENKITQLHEYCHQFLRNTSYGAQSQIISLGSSFAFIDMLRMVVHGKISTDKFARLGRTVINSYQLMAKMSKNWTIVQESFANIYPYHVWSLEQAKKGVIRDDERIDFVRSSVEKSILRGLTVPSWYRKIVKDALELYEKRGYEDFVLAIVQASYTPLFLESKFLHDPDRLNFRGRTKINPDLRFEILRKQLIAENDDFKTVVKCSGIVAFNPSFTDFINYFNIFDDILDPEEINTIKNFHKEQFTQGKHVPNLRHKHLPVKVVLDPLEGVDIECCPVWLGEKKLTKSDVSTTRGISILKRIFVENLLFGKPVPVCFAQPLADGVGIKMECQNPQSGCKWLLEMVTKTIEEFAKITNHAGKETRGSGH
jgi:hypothetical protein